MHGPQSCHQFIDRERFHQVVINSGIQGCDAVMHIVMPGQHQDRRVDSTSSHSLADVDATEVRKIPVKNDQVGFRFTAASDQAGCTIVRDVDLISLHIEFETQQIRETTFIVNDQDTGSITGFLGHACRSSPFNLGASCLDAGMSSGISGPQQSPQSVFNAASSCGSRSNRSGLRM